MERLIVDCETGEQTLVPLDADDLAQIDADRVAVKKRLAEPTPPTAEERIAALEAEVSAMKAAE